LFFLAILVFLLYRVLFFAALCVSNNNNSSPEQDLTQLDPTRVGKIPGFGKKFLSFKMSMYKENRT